MNLAEKGLWLSLGLVMRAGFRSSRSRGRNSTDTPKTRQRFRQRRFLETRCLELARLALAAKAQQQQLCLLLPDPGPGLNCFEVAQVDRLYLLRRGKQVLCNLVVTEETQKANETKSQ